MRELVYYAAVTLDGYIAGPNGEFDAFLIEGDHMEGINARFADTPPPPSQPQRSASPRSASSSTPC